MSDEIRTRPATQEYRDGWDEWQLGARREPTMDDFVSYGEPEETFAEFRDRARRLSGADR